MDQPGRAQAIAALLRMHSPATVRRMLADIDAGKSPAEVTLGAYRHTPAISTQEVRGDDAR